MSNLPISTYTRSVASLSWIDPITKLPEVDKRGNPGDKIHRSTIVGQQEYRFANFLEAYIKVIDVRGGAWLLDAGFTKESGIYRSLSYGDIPSEQFSIKQSIDKLANGIQFTQIVGARTQSPEIIAERWGGTIGREVAELITAFPPIWTKLQLTIYRDGFYDRKVVQHSLFPSMTFYESHFIDVGNSGGLGIKVLRENVIENKTPNGIYQHVVKNLGAIVEAKTDNFYRSVTNYDGVPFYGKWKDSGWGKLVPGYTAPTQGNPWSIPDPSGFGMGRPDEPGRMNGDPRSAE
jgi:hypothetical protein